MQTEVLYALCVTRFVLFEILVAPIPVQMVLWLSEQNPNGPTLNIG